MSIPGLWELCFMISEWYLLLRWAGYELQLPVATLPTFTFMFYTLLPSCQSRFKLAAFTITCYYSSGRYSNSVYTFPRRQSRGVCIGIRIGRLETLQVCRGDARDEISTEKSRYSLVFVWVRGSWASGHVYRWRYISNYIHAARYSTNIRENQARPRK